jgi:microcystin degradation protein MlrC
MHSLERTAREMEAADPNLLEMNILAGFAFSDVSSAGISFCAVTINNVSAQLHLNRLATIADQSKHLGLRREADLEEVLTSLEGKAGGPYLLIEPADNIGAGTSGRAFGVLEALLRRKIRNAAVAMQAPEHVAALAHYAIGSPVAFSLEDPFAHQSLAISGTLRSRSDGRFTLEDPQSHLASMGGASIDMGPCAVVECDGISILLTSKRTPPFDLGQFRSQGIEPEKLFLVGIKAAVAHRRAWDPIAASSFWVEVAGPCSSNLRRLPYQRLRRPIYPLDEP